MKGLTRNIGEPLDRSRHVVTVWARVAGNGAAIAYVGLALTGLASLFPELRGAFLRTIGGDCRVMVGDRIVGHVAIHGEEIEVNFHAETDQRPDIVNVTELIALAFGAMGKAVRRTRDDVRGGWVIEADCAAVGGVWEREEEPNTQGEQRR